MGMWSLLSVRISQQQYSEDLHPFLMWMERHCNLLPVTTSWEENDLFSTSTDSCRSSERRVCLNTMAFLMLSCNVIHPSQVARNVCFIFCLLVSSSDTKMFLIWRKNKVKDWFSLLVTCHIFVTKKSSNVATAGLWLEKKLKSKKKKSLWPNKHNDNLT